MNILIQMNGNDKAGVLTWLENLTTLFLKNSIELFYTVQVKGSSYSQLCKDNANDVLVLPYEIRSITRKRLMGLSFYPITIILRNAYCNHRNNTILKNFVRQKNVDIIITNSYLNIPKNFSKSKTKVLAVIHTVPNEDNTIFKLKTNYIRHLLRRADKVICVGNVIKERLGRTNDDNMLVIENGCQDMSRKKNQRDELRNQFGIPSDCICLGTIGRLTKDKGVLEFLHIFEKLAVEYPHLQCVIGGDPVSCEDEIYLENVDNEINSSKHKERIHRLGYVNKIDFYPLIDIFCLVTVNTIEAFGLVVIEAMSAGIPPIAPRAGGPVDIIDNGVSGFLVTPGSVKEYCEKILNLLENKEVYRDVSTSAIERYKDKYTMAVWGKKWMTLLEEIS